jgi:hypothetical protein
LWNSQKTIDAFLVSLSQFEIDGGARSVRSLGDFRITIFDPDIVRHRSLEPQVSVKLLDMLPALRTITFKIFDADIIPLRQSVRRAGRTPFTGDQLRANLGLEALVSAILKSVCCVVILCYRSKLRGARHEFDNLFSELRRLVHCTDRRIVVETVWKEMIRDIC